MQENNQENIEQNNELPENEAPEIQEEQAQEKAQEPTAEEIIAQLEQKASDLNDKLLRSLAELENVRRRSKEEVSKAAKYSISNFASDLVVVVENFFLATNNAPKEEIEKSEAVKNFAQGIDMTKNELVKILEKNQIKRVFPLNEPFNHNVHEAISQIEIPEGSQAKSGDVLQVIQAGYSIADRLIRPALVVVAK